MNYNKINIYYKFFNILVFIIKLNNFFFISLLIILIIKKYINKNINIFINLFNIKENLREAGGRGERGGLRSRVVLVDPPPVGELAARAVVAGAVAPGPELDLRRPVPPQLLICSQRSRHACRTCAGAEQLGQRHGVLQRLVHALPQVRQHRVRRVPEQRQAPAAPPRQWHPVVHPPLKPAAARPGGSRR